MTNTIADAEVERLRVAIALWRADAERAAPNVLRYRTDGRFPEQTPEELRRWFSQADAAIAALREQPEPHPAIADAAAVREACARVAEATADHEGPFTDYFRGRDQGCHDAAAAIRSMADDIGGER